MRWNRFDKRVFPENFRVLGKIFIKNKIFLKNYLTNANQFDIICKRQDGRLAQLGEHLPYKQRVTGSSPVLSTKVI